MPLARPRDGRSPPPIRPGSSHFLNLIPFSRNRNPFTGFSVSFSSELRLARAYIDGAARAAAALYWLSIKRSTRPRRRAVDGRDELYRFHYQRSQPGLRPTAIAGRRGLQPQRTLPTATSPGSWRPREPGLWLRPCCGSPRTPGRAPSPRRRRRRPGSRRGFLLGGRCAR